MTFVPYQYEDHVTQLNAATMAAITSDVFDQATAAASTELANFVPPVTPVGRRTLGVQSLSGSVTYQTKATDVVLVVELLLFGNSSVSFAPLTPGLMLLVKGTQAGAGGYSVTFSQLRGSQPLFATAVGAVTVVSLACPDGSNLYVPNSAVAAQAATISDSVATAQTGT